MGVAEAVGGVGERGAAADGRSGAAEGAAGADGDVSDSSTGRGPDRADFMCNIPI